MGNTLPKRLTVKVGSNILTRSDGNLNVTRMSALVDQIAYLRSKGIEIILVSSGAVASGRSMINPEGDLSEVDSRQLFSAIGQAKLMGRYCDLFRDHGIVVGQVLTMKESFSTPELYNNQRNCMRVMLRNNVIPIVNENDTVSLGELMFTDNDELSGVIATMMGCDSLIILTNVDGVYDGDPSSEGSSPIRTILPGDNLDAYISSTKSSHGRGGIVSKTRVARKVASEGVEVVVACGNRENILPDLIERRGYVPCTVFVPSKVDKSVKEGE
ncbi:MAG: glutamate 5-kinase [Bacteroidales bacterium]|nr:glutamate 5-kinase [Bacteroidales bacterium]